MIFLLNRERTRNRKVYNFEIESRKSEYPRLKSQANEKEERYLHQRILLSLYHIRIETNRIRKGLRAVAFMVNWQPEEEEKGGIKHTPSQ